jgi:hypothetical protein
MELLRQGEPADAVGATFRIPKYQTPPAKTPATRV